MQKETLQISSRRETMDQVHNSFLRKVAAQAVEASAG